MRVSKVSLCLRSSTRSGERRRGSVGVSHCHDEVVIGSPQSGGNCHHRVVAEARTEEGCLSLSSVRTSAVTTRVVAEGEGGGAFSP